MRFASRLSPFGISIAHVICYGSEEKMRRPNASAIVASMKNQKSFLDLSELHFPGNAMCIYHTGAFGKTE
jgi:hypothetical protein